MIPKIGSLRHSAKASSPASIAKSATLPKHPKQRTAPGAKVGASYKGAQPRLSTKKY